jgi:hypothetical protein
MNVELIYKKNREETFARQFADTKYRTFVAMPFGTAGGYPVQRIHKLLASVHKHVNKKLPANAKRDFAQLRRVDEITSGTMVITDEIIRQILENHFFWADITGCNFGVVLETGLALALKPNKRVIVFTQDGLYRLHFDLRVTRVGEYNEKTLVPKLVDELVKAAKSFEDETDRYVVAVSTRLTSDAIMLLNIYGRRYKDWPIAGQQPALFQRAAADNNPIFKGEVGRVLFQEATRELNSHGLLWTYYKPNAVKGKGDAYGVHATELGWTVY